jgi:hypothetical protein
MAHGKDV